MIRPVSDHWKIASKELPLETGNAEMIWSCDYRDSEIWCALAFDEQSHQSRVLTPVSTFATPGAEGGRVSVAADGSVIFTRSGSVGTVLVCEPEGRIRTSFPCGGGVLGAEALDEHILIYYSRELIDPSSPEDDQRYLDDSLTRLGVDLFTYDGERLSLERAQESWTTYAYCSIDGQRAASLMLEEPFALWTVDSRSRVAAAIPTPEQLRGGSAITSTHWGYLVAMPYDDDGIYSWDLSTGEVELIATASIPPPNFFHKVRGLRDGQLVVCDEASATVYTFANVGPSGLAEAQ